MQPKLYVSALKDMQQIVISAIAVVQMCLWFDRLDRDFVNFLYFADLFPHAIKVGECVSYYIPRDGRQ